MTTLSQLKARAEKIRDGFEEARGKLYRGDGTQVFGDDEHAERLAKLRRERNEELGNIEDERAALVERANNEISDFENGGPTAWLTADEQEAASGRLALVRADVANLGHDELIERLKVVSRSGDRASQVSYWLAARGKVSGTEDVQMLEALDKLKEAAIPDSLSSKVEAARQSLRDAYEVESVTHLARRELSGALGGYAPNYIRPANSRVT